LLNAFVTSRTPLHNTKQERACGGLARFILCLAFVIPVCVNLRRWVGLLDADAAEVAP
jgi:hypothetical protein